MSNQNSWKLTWNKDYYNYEKLIDDIKKGSHNGLIIQQIGKFRIKNKPEMNDIVYISCNKRMIMKAVVITPVFNSNYIDPYSIGTYNQQSNKFCIIKIEHIYENPKILLGSQRIWAQI